MVSRRTVLGILASTFAPGGLAHAGSPEEPPYFKTLVESGKLPPLALRLPQVPRVVNLAAKGRQLGRYGGNVRMLIGGQRDIRLMTIYGYARLVGYDESLNLQPDILESFEVVDGR